MGLVVGLVLGAGTPAIAQEAGVVVAELALPPAGAAYRGSGPHVFPQANARLTCSTHGVFSTSTSPPSAPGTSAVVDYHATFVGELAVGPPEDETRHAINGRVHMAERLSFAERRGSELALDTELVVFDLQGGGLPRGVLVRESPTLASTGRATATALGRGRHLVDGHYDVWLEISTDGGRSWSRAEAAVRMMLAPATAPARMEVAPGS